MNTHSGIVVREYGLANSINKYLQMDKEILVILKSLQSGQNELKLKINETYKMVLAIYCSEQLYYSQRVLKK